MRTKTLLLTAGLIAAGALSSMAQSNVYSVNVVGYVNVSVTGGSPSKFTAIANPLDAGTNTLATLFPNPPNGANFYKWNGNGFTIATFFFGSWDQPNITLNPGEGGFILTDTSFTQTFAGSVLQGNLTNSLSSGFTMVSSKAPVTGTPDSLNLTPALGNGDNLYKWNFGTQGYDIYTLFFGSYSPSTPTLNVGESFFTLTAASNNWTTNFVVQ